MFIYEVLAFPVGCSSKKTPLDGSMSPRQFTQRELQTPAEVKNTKNTSDGGREQLILHRERREIFHFYFQLVLSIKTVFIKIIYMIK